MEIYQFGPLYLLLCQITSAELCLATSLRFIESRHGKWSGAIWYAFILKASVLDFVHEAHELSPGFGMCPFCLKTTHK